MPTLLQNCYFFVSWKGSEVVLAVSTALPILACCPALQMYLFSQRSHYLYFTVDQLRNSILSDKLRQVSVSVNGFMQAS